MTILSLAFTQWNPFIRLQKPAKFGNGKGRTWGFHKVRFIPWTHEFSGSSFVLLDIRSTQCSLVWASDIDVTPADPVLNLSIRLPCQNCTTFMYGKTYFSSREKWPAHDHKNWHWKVEWSSRPIRRSFNQTNCVKIVWCGNLQGAYNIAT